MESGHDHKRQESVNLRRRSQRRRYKRKMKLSLIIAKKNISILLNYTTIYSVLLQFSLDLAVSWYSFSIQTMSSLLRKMNFQNIQI